jgi:hypothetical protein
MSLNTHRGLSLMTAYKRQSIKDVPPAILYFSFDGIILP